MRRSFTALTAALSALALVAGLVGPFGSVAAADQKASLASVVAGTWMGTITAAPAPDAPPPAPVLLTFSADGTVVESNGLGPGVGHGAWVQTGANTFTFAFLKLLFDPAGKLSGMVRTQVNVTLNSAGDGFSGPGKAEIMDPTGKVLATLDAAGPFTRFRVVPRP